MITLDAMQTQDETTKVILNAGADYVFTGQGEPSHAPGPGHDPNLMLGSSGPQRVSSDDADHVIACLRPNLDSALDQGDPHLDVVDMVA